MAQVSYGTITIIDTNDIESITIEYARNQDPLTAPTSGWDTTRPTWAQGYYIWQRTRVHKTGTDTSTDTFGDAVCLTGSTGQTGSAGQSLTATKTQYTHVASNVTITTSNHTSYTWTDNVPEYDSTKPVYWGRITNTYTNPAKTEYLVYKDNGLTEAIAQSVEANANASDALDKANEAESIAQQTIEDAQGALGIARAMQQNFWWWGTDQTVDSSFTLPAGAYTSDVKVDTFKANPTGGYLVTRSDGVYLNNGQYVLMGLTGNALKFYRPGTTKLLSGTETVDAQLTSSGLQITNGSIVLGSTSGITAGSVALSNTNFTRSINGTQRDDLRLAIGSKFGVSDSGTLYADGANIINIAAANITADTLSAITANMGTLTAGTISYGPTGSNNTIYLSANSSKSATIAGALRENLRFTVGRNFGVDNTGKLYASGAEISGKIIVSADSGSNVYTSDEVDDKFATQESIPTSVNELEDISTYATKQEVTEVDNFVKSHIEIDDTSISFVADNADVVSKLMMSIDGLSLYGNGGIPLAEYGEDAIIGSKDSFHIRIVTSNSDPDLNGIFFYQGENPVAYINGNRLYISQSVVLQQMDVGTPMNNGTGGQWSWKVHPVDNKNNLYLKWLG